MPKPKKPFLGTKKVSFHRKKYFWGQKRSAFTEKIIFGDKNSQRSPKTEAPPRPRATSPARGPRLTHRAPRPTCSAPTRAPRAPAAAIQLLLVAKTFNPDTLRRTLSDVDTGREPISPVRASHISHKCFTNGLCA